MRLYGFGNIEKLMGIFEAPQFQQEISKNKEFSMPKYLIFKALARREIIIYMYIRIKAALHVKIHQEIIILKIST